MYLKKNINKIIYSFKILSLMIKTELNILKNNSFHFDCKIVTDDDCTQRMSESDNRCYITRTQFLTNQ